MPPFSSHLTFFLFWTLLSTALWGQTLPPAADPSRRAESVSLQPGRTPLRDDVTMGAASINDLDLFAPASPGDNDLGDQLILKDNARDLALRFMADSYVFWTDNAAHVSDGELDDVFWGWRAAANWQPRLTDTFYLDIGVAQEWYRYDELNVLDFENLEASAGFFYIEPRLANILFFAQYQFGHLTTDFDDLLTTHSLRAGLQKLFLINRKHSIYAALIGDWDVEADVDQLKRNEYIADIGWRYALTFKVTLTLTYRYTYFDYTEVDRGDHYQGVGFNLSYMPWKWLEVYATTSYAFNNSSFAVYDYEAANLGGGVGFRVKF